MSPKVPRDVTGTRFIRDVPGGVRSLGRDVHVVDAADVVGALR